MVDDEDYEMLMAYTNIWYLDVGGYAVATRDKKGMHRVIMGLKREDPRIDHDDRNKLNNQKNNLLEATNRLNCLNRPLSTNKSGYTGVRMQINKTCVSWHMSHKQNDGVHLQVVYSCKHTAAHAYNKQLDISMGGCRGHRNDLSDSGFTIEELDQKLITDRLLLVGRRWKK
jgi:hypothetical protein